MAKKKKETVVEEPIVEETVTIEEPIIETPKVVVETKKSKRTDPVYKKSEDGWEIRDRMYRLKGSRKPLSRSIKSADIYYFDEEKGYERELKYCENQKNLFCRRNER